MLHRNEKVELIKKIPLFAGGSKSELEQIAQIADEIDLREGKEMTQQGSRGREFFVLLEGEADVTKDGLLDDQPEFQRKVLVELAERLAPDHL